MKNLSKLWGENTAEYLWQGAVISCIVFATAYFGEHFLLYLTGYYEPKSNIVIKQDKTEPVYYAKKEGKVIALPEHGLGSTEETNRLLGGDYF